MFRVALRNLRAHKLRLVLSTLAVVLGVAFVAGSLIFTDTLKKTFDDLFTQVAPDVQITAAPAFEGANDNADSGASLPASLLPTVADVNGVDKAIGQVQVNGVSVVGRDGKLVSTSQAPAFGVGWTGDADLSPLHLVSGEGPTASGQIAIDEQTADKGGFAVGDSVEVLTPGTTGQTKQKIVGVFRFGSTGNLAGASITAFDMPSAQKLLLGADAYTAIAVKADAGVSQDQLAQSIKQVVPANTKVQTGAEASDEQSDSINEGLSFFNILFLAFAAIALLVGIFLIINTFTMLVTQRARELALLRALGASRSQVTRSVLLEALFVGIIGSTIGLLGGIGLALGIKALLAAIGVDIPTGSLVIKPRTVIVCYIVGIAVTLIAALLPSIRASRVPPVAAMRDDVTIPVKSLRRRIIGGAIVTVLGVLALVSGATNDSGGDGAGLVGFGALLTIIGVTIIAPVLARPFVRTVGWPFKASGSIVGRLAVDNASRNRRRTASTAAALMIGLAVVSTFAILGSSITASTDATIDRSVGADFIVQPVSFGAGGFSPSIGKAVSEVDGVDTVTAVENIPVQVNGSGTTLVAVDPATADQAVKLPFEEGSWADMTEGTIVVDTRTAEDNSLKVGDTVQVTFPQGKTELKVVGTYTPQGTFSGYVISPETARAEGVPERPFNLFVSVKDGTDPSSVRPGIEKALAPYPNVELQDQTEFKDAIRKSIGQILSLVYVLLALSIFIAILGIVNTLALSVIERRREIGLLRAVGMLRKQLRRTVVLEAVIIAVFGAVLGVVLGLAFGLSLQHVLATQGLDVLEVPVGQLVAFVIVAAVVGVLAALWPARRAAKTDILKAITTD